MKLKESPGSSLELISGLIVLAVFPWLVSASASYCVLAWNTIP